MRRLRSLVVASVAFALAPGTLLGAASAEPLPLVRGPVEPVELAPSGPLPADADGVVAPVTADAEPVAPEVELVDLDDAETLTADADDATSSDDASADDATVLDSGATLEDAADGTAQATFQAPVAALVIVGVSWDLASAPEDLAIEWRADYASGWSDWEELHVELEDAPDDPDAAAGMRDGTVPLAVMDAGAVEVMVSSAEGEMPEGMTFAVVDPGESEGDDLAGPTTATSGGSGSSVGGPAGTVRVNPAAIDVAKDNAANATRPTIYSRAQWGADESMMTWDPSQGRVQGIDIHHTVNANDYSRAEVPGIIRGIYAYHAQDWGRGWGDIGYNFLVDRFGRIWEGRYGGVDQAPIGAHATGLNSNMSGISLIGNFEITPVPAAAFTAVAKVAAWKLWLHGVSTSYGTITLDAGTFNRISGHRDAKQTTCPGRYMYNRLPEMRSRIKSYIGSFSSRYLDRDLDGDGHADLVVVEDGAVSLTSTVERRVWARSVLSTSWSTVTGTVGDVTGDGYPDTFRRVGGTLYVYPTSANGRVDSARRITVGTGWTGRTPIGGLDVTGDGRPDLLAWTSDGRLLLYRGTGGGRFAYVGNLGRDWSDYTQLTLVEDFKSGKDVLVAQHDSGVLQGIPIANSRLGTRYRIATGWDSRRLLTGVGDMDDDGVGDLVVIDASERLWLVPGTGSGGVSSVSGRTLLANGQSSVDQIAPAHQLDSRPTFHLVVNGSDLLIKRVDVREAYTSTVRTGLTVGANDRVVAAGDWSGNGVNDLLVVRSSGAVMLHPGTGGGRFRTTGTRIGTISLLPFEQVVGVGNYVGDGRPGLVAFNEDTGQLWHYGSDGAGGFRPRILVSNGAEGMDFLAYAGRLNGPSSPDLLMRGAGSYRLFFYDGNGPGLALPPERVTNPWSGTAAIVGVNDVTGDGIGDIVRVTSSGTVRLYPGRSNGTLSPSTVVGSLPDDAKVS